MFGANGSNVFAKKIGEESNEAQAEQEGDDESPVKYGDSQSPDRVLVDHPLCASPFEKLYEIDTDKFKIVKPEKRNCGIGKVSIHKGEFDSKDKDSQSKTVIYKVVYKNVIGKTLYDANISGKFSKSRKIPEKAYKNQLKIAVVKTVEVDEEGAKKRTNQLQYCQINFKRSDDLEAFVKHFEASTDALKLKNDE